jgi:NAD(P)-dependent dehydrogenase (short-subunit alcohol dehydrogenase family)
MSYASTTPFKGRVAIVTGGAGGIGLETSKALQENGATLVISDINADRGEKVAQDLGIDFFPADVTRSAEVCNLAQHVQERHGRIDIAFNNAGVVLSAPAEECTDEDWLKVINTNLNAVFLLLP